MTGAPKCYAYLSRRRVQRRGGGAYCTYRQVQAGSSRGRGIPTRRPYARNHVSRAWGTQCKVCVAGVPHHPRRRPEANDTEVQVRFVCVFYRRHVLKNSLLQQLVGC